MPLLLGVISSASLSLPSSSLLLPPSSLDVSLASLSLNPNRFGETTFGVFGDFVLGFGVRLLWVCGDDSVREGGGDGDGDRPNLIGSGCKSELESGEWASVDASIHRVLWSRLNPARQKGRPFSSRRLRKHRRHYDASRPNPDVFLHTSSCHVPHVRLWRAVNLGRRHGHSTTNKSTLRVFGKSALSLIRLQDIHVYCQRAGKKLFDVSKLNVSK